MPIRKLLVLLLLVGTGCSENDPYASRGGSSSYGDYYGTDEITFLDEAASNGDLDAGLTSLSFVTASGEENQLDSIAPGKNLVVVVTRGNTVPICPYCSTQVSNLIANYQAFEKLNTEVVAVYPIETGDDSGRLNVFLQDVKQRVSDPDKPVPFPVLLDVELKGVDRLGIRKDLSKPATYVVDAQGDVRYAYVGAHLADRPSVDVMLQEVGQINNPGGAGSSEAPPGTDERASDPAEDVPQEES